MSTRTVLVPLAEGVEEIEAVSLIDVLRRAGAEVTVASIHDHAEVTASRGVRLVADALLRDLDGRNFDLIALPGGTRGAENFRDCAPLVERLKRQRAEGRRYAAICASPALVLAPHGLLDGRRACCYPSFADRLPDPGLADLAVVVDGPCTTSQGPGTAITFALALVEELFDRARREEVGRALLALP